MWLVYENPSNIHFKYLLILYVCVYTCLGKYVYHVCAMTAEIKIGCQIPKTRVTIGYEATHRCREPNLGPLKEQWSLN